ncbi:MAG: sporulation protein YtfJ [Oscillospiraceae bacterium]|nr:sporulation protein YtfJ [Oscillospiraceae bacterium]
MSEQSKVKELVAEAMTKVHQMADANTMLGDPVKLDGGVTIIPVSKISYGFASGGSDLPSKQDKEFFGGASGGGVTINPLGFLVITGQKVELLQINLDYGNKSAIVDMVPEVFNKVSALFKKDEPSKDKKLEKAEAHNEKVITDAVTDAVESSEEKSE